MARKQRKTLRKMAPLAREVAKLANDLASINTRLMNLTKKIAKAEANSDALAAFMVSMQPDEEEGD